MAFTSVIFSRKIEKDDKTKHQLARYLNSIVQGGYWDKWTFTIETEKPLPMSILKEIEIELKDTVNRLYRGIFTDNE